jgi:hypothetical protein
LFAGAVGWEGWFVPTAWKPWAWWFGGGRCEKWLNL